VTKDEVFVYDFPAEKAGTYWIHSHALGQYPKGLRSPLIITDPEKPAQLGYSSYSDGPGAFDKVVTLSDQ
jgi:FtsP/CotA-like multicopper oxidase with cupredoxin domain